MSSKPIEQEILARVAAFATELGSLIRQSVLTGVHQVLGEAPASPAAGRPRTQASPSAPAAAPAKRGRAAKKTGRKRGRPAAVPSAALVDAIGAYVASNPGTRMEGLSQSLGKKSDALRVAVNSMLQSGELMKTGQKRGTQYFPGDGTPQAAPAPGPARKKAGKKAGKKTAKKRTTKKRVTKKSAA